MTEPKLVSLTKSFGYFPAGMLFYAEELPGEVFNLYSSVMQFMVSNPVVAKIPSHYLQEAE